MKLRIRYEHWIFKVFLRKYAGVVLYPWVLFKHKEVPQSLFRHELEHVYQVERDGWLKFYLRYLYWNVKYGYEENPYEVEARAAAHLPLTEAEWKLLG